MPRRNNSVRHTRLNLTPIDNCSPKKKFNTQKEATNAAEYQMLINLDLELSTYKCDQCHKWHLTRQSKTN